MDIKKLTYKLLSSRSRFNIPLNDVGREKRLDIYHPDFLYRTDFSVETKLPSMTNKHLLEISSPSGGGKLEGLIIEYLPRKQLFTELSLFLRRNHKKAVGR